MRLTLRTLLAWLDDTLPPSQVREIGMQVKESPLARELADRIARVTRQRRLTVPGSSGPEGTDANTVASYLDNELDPEAVAEYEKRCLSSDVHLAEAASVHQILSLLGQKVKVPSAVRARMYQLVKGRETRSARTRARTGSSLNRLDVVASPLPEWHVAEPDVKTMAERLAPLAACLLLGLVAVWSAWRSVTSEVSPLAFKIPAATKPAQLVAAGRPAEPAMPPVEPPPVVAAAEPVAEAEAKPTAPTEPAPEKPAAETAALAKTAEASALAKDAAAKADLKPAPKIKSRLGVLEAPDALALRYDPDQRQWTRLAERTTIARSDRILCLEPFRASLPLGGARFELIGETDIRLVSAADDPAPAVELGHGRLVVRQPSSTSIRIGSLARPLRIEASQDSVIGIERAVRRVEGRPADPYPPLVIYCAQGEITLVLDKKRATLTVTNAAHIASGGTIELGSPDAPPAWTAGGEPPAFENQLRDQFFKMIQTGRPIMAELVAAIDDKRPEIKKLSVAAIKALGDYSLLVPLMSREGDQVARRAAIAAVRESLGLSPESATRMRDQLSEEFGEERLALVEKMLDVHSRADAANAELLGRLVVLLEPEQESLGLRELALDDLKRMTGRDDLGYDPDHPQGRGLAAWRDIARRVETKSQTGGRGR